VSPIICFLKGYDIDESLKRLCLFTRSQHGMSVHFTTVVSDYWEWIVEIKLSPTLLPELDKEYEARHDDENMDRAARMRQCEEDLIWRNHLQNQE
jgi:hypothetical protein